MPIVQVSAGGNISEEIRDKMYSNLAQELLAHLYSPSVEYQHRFVSTFYHPTLATYSDPFLLVQDCSRIERLFKFNFAWFVKNGEVCVHHVSGSSSTVSFALQRPSSVISTAFGKSGTEGIVGMFSPTTQTSSDPLDTIIVQRPVTVILIDYNLLVRELTLLGHLMRILWILPFPISMAYYPGSYSLNRGKNISGLRLITKLTWLPDTLAPPQSASLLQEKGFFVKHEDIYAATRISGNFMAFIWLTLSSLLVCTFQISFNIISRMLSFSGKIIDMVIPTSVLSIPMVQIIKGRIYNLKKNFDLLLPSDFESVWKSIVGYFWIDFILRNLSL